MIRGVEYLDYDKISDDLCWLGNKCVVRIVVKLSSKNKDGLRSHFHKEFKYDSSYKDKKEVITIRRSFDYYITIDHLEYKQSIMITIKDIINLRMQLNEVFKWFYDKTFAIKNKNMIILEKKKPIIIDGLVGSKYLMFEPIVYIDWEEKQSKGVRITLGDNNIFTDIPVNTFAGFLYLINTIDMFSTAQNMINYIGHPDFGTNLITFEKEYKEQVINNIIKDRQIPNRKKTSYFDTLDNL